MLSMLFCTFILLVLQLVIYGVDGGFEPPFAIPFDNSLLGQKFRFYLEYALVPGGAEVPAQLIIDAFAAEDVHAVAGAFDEARALQAGYAHQLVHILQRVRCYRIACHRASACIMRGH